MEEEIRKERLTCGEGRSKVKGSEGSRGRILNFNTMMPHKCRRRRRRRKAVKSSHVSVTDLVISLIPCDLLTSFHLTY